MDARQAIRLCGEVTVLRVMWEWESVSELTITRRITMGFIAVLIATVALFIVSAGPIISIGVSVLVSASAWWWVRSRIQRRLRMIVEDFADDVGQTQDSNEQVSAASQLLAENAGKQAAALEETSASIEQILIMIQESAQRTQQVHATSQDNSQTSEQARGLVEDAQRDATEGMTAMQEMAQTIDGMKDAAEKTGKIVTTIDEIAFQTNLLALNAAVEAARAGEAGKGFAVVAEEVRSLAGRSARAARETGQLIDESVRNSDQGVSATRRVESVFQDIVDRVTQLAELVGKVAAASDRQVTLVGEVNDATADQASKMQQVNAGVVQIDTVTQANAASAEELAGNAHELKNHSARLREGVIGLGRLIDGQTDRRTEFRLDRPDSGRLRRPGGSAREAQQNAGEKFDREPESASPERFQHSKKPSTPYLIRGESSGDT
ncbi:MAG: methyl-accepting chemotaxis protein [Phycisphaerae bacterium]